MIQKIIFTVLASDTGFGWVMFTIGMTFGFIAGTQL